jgi:hypothetical protein
MRRSEPPSLATWMLDHAVPGGRDEGLAGDLLEEFRAGRTEGWYWRQVVSAIAIAFARAVGDNASLLLFSALWSMLAPAWLLIVRRAEERLHVTERFYRMDWPWSMVCDLGLLMMVNLVFIWAGIVVYLLPDLMHAGRRLRSIARGFAASLRILMLVWVVLIALPKYFLAVEQTSRPVLGPVPTYRMYKVDLFSPLEVARVAPQDEWTARYGHPVMVMEPSACSLITDMKQATVIVRLPFFLVLLCALWRVSPSVRIRNMRTPG